MNPYYEESLFEQNELAPRNSNSLAWFLATPVTECPRHSKLFDGWSNWAFGQNIVMYFLLQTT